MVKQRQMNSMALVIGLSQNDSAFYMLPNTEIMIYEVLLQLESV